MQSLKRLSFAVFLWFTAFSGLRAAQVPLSPDLPASRIEIDVHATVDSFVGSLAAYKLEVGVDAQSGNPMSASLSFHFSDLKTGKEGRDAKMLKWLETSTWPDGTFVLTSLAPDGSGAFKADGKLTLHGKTVDVTFPVKVTHKDKRITIEGEAKLNTQDFGLPIIRMMGLLKVDPVVGVRIHVEGTHE